MYIITIPGSNGEPIAKPSFYWCMLDTNLKNVVYTQNVNIFIRLSVGMLVRSSREGSDRSWFRTIARTPSIGNLVNWLTTFHRINSTKSSEFLRYDGNFPAGGLTISTGNLISEWHAEPL